MSDRKMRPPFYTLHAASLDPATTADQLADALRAAEAMPERRRASEGAVYGTACRRYQYLTGQDWRDSQQPTEATAWGESDHQLRLDSHGFSGWVWRCSCGESGTDQDPNAAHAAHVEQASAVTA